MQFANLSTLNYFDLYRRYTQGQESPEPFHYWTSVSVLATILGRNVWLDRGRYTLYPNHFIILVSGSALSRKSSALNVGVRLLKAVLGGAREAEPNLHLPVVLANKMTPEALCKAISTHGLDSMFGEGTKMDEKRSRPVALIASELGVFMSKAAQANGLIDLLMDFYDCPDEWEYITKTTGTDLVYNVCCNMLSATTPDWIASNVTGSVFNQGLVGRTIFVHSDRADKRIAHPTLTTDEKHCYEFLRQLLTNRLTMRGEYQFDPPAADHYEQWYMSIADQDESSLVSGFVGRKHDHVLKHAMVIAAAKRHERILLTEDIDDAVAAVEHIAQTFPAVFTEVRQTNEIYETGLVENLLRTKGPLSKSDLLRLTYKRLKKEQLEEALADLKAAGIVGSEKVKPARGPSKVIYKHQSFKT